MCGVLEKNQAETIKKGREVFIAQLKNMQAYEKVIDWMEEEDKDYPAGAIEMFEVPEELITAFLAYHADFIRHTGMATSEEGVFYNDEDTMAGIMSKFFYFFDPFKKMLKNENPDLLFEVVIQPSYEDRTKVLIKADNSFSANLLPVSVVLYEEDRRPAHTYDEALNDPEYLYKELGRKYETMASNLKVALALKSAFASTTHD